VTGIPIVARLASILLMWAALEVAPGAAAERPVDLLLVLAVDASGSVDATRFELQRRGHRVTGAEPTPTVQNSPSANVHAPGRRAARR